MDQDAIPTYTLAERQRRWDISRKFILDQGLDALIVYGEHEDAGAAPYTFDNWFTNDRPGSTVVFPRDGEPFVLVPFMNFFADHMEGLARQEGVWIKAQNMRAGRDAEPLIHLLNELQLSEGKVGVLGLEPAPPWHPEGLIPFNLWAKVKEALPKVTFRAVAAELIPAMLPLGQEEIAIIKRAARVGDDMAQAMVEAIKSGATERDIYAAGMATAFSNGTVVPWLHLNTGPQAVTWGAPRWAWRPQAPRDLQDGDQLTSEIFCSYGMRHTQHQLAVAIGNVSEEVTRAATLARASYDAGLKALRPGARFGDVAASMQEPVSKAGGWVKGPQIHSLNPIAALCGFSPPVHFLKASEGSYPEISGMPTALSEMILKEGMSFAFEPSCGFGMHCVTLGTTVLVGKDGPVELGTFTTKLHHVSLDK